MTNQRKTFKSTEDSQFFASGKFNFKSLARQTTSEFASRIKNVVGFYQIKTLNYSDNGRCIFLRFYATGMEDEYKVINGYWNKEDYFDVDYISHIDMAELGLKVVKEEKENEQTA